MKSHHRSCIVPLVLILAIAGGCGKSGDDKAADKKAASQVAAKVNSTEITVSQVNAVLARTPNVPPEVADRAKREILDRLIDQELAKQQAIKKKLDRRPNVLQVLENARSEILARAYLEQIAAEQPKPTPEEAKKYFAEHPELFSQRRVFDIEEFVVEPKADLAAALREQVTRARSMQEIATWLKSREARFAANRVVRAAEQIPFELMPKLHGMKDGEIRVFEAAGGAQQVVRVVASKSAPVNEATATPRIQQFLFNRSSGEAIVKEMKAIKETAKIEYIGEFAASAAEVEAKANAAAEAKAKELANAKAKAEAEAQARAEAKAKTDADAQARAEALAKARAEAEKARLEAAAKATPSKPVQLPPGAIDKGVRGLR